ncbi:hypothetical protein EKO27_g9622 [Xylaria grammica]|uniref:Uncharacterized protein n=1 Tax=Xylaria grammica TaxID=363999 RepID=A0A439CTJ4_9PEZI|nr:hypothetical protein EKO27_g9622 [Xylaria grammica]
MPLDKRYLRSKVGAKRQFSMSSVPTSSASTSVDPTSSTDDAAVTSTSEAPSSSSTPPPDTETSTTEEPSSTPPSTTSTPSSSSSETPTSTPETSTPSSTSDPATSTSSTPPPTSTPTSTTSSEPPSSTETPTSSSSITSPSSSTSTPFTSTSTSADSASTETTTITSFATQTSGSGVSTTSSSASGTPTLNGGGGSSSSLDQPGKIAVAVVVPIAGVALIVLAGLFFWRRRKQRRDAEEERRKEVEDYAYNPNNDPTLPNVGGGGAFEMKEDASSGYRGWGSTTLAGSTGRKASTTMSGAGEPLMSDGSHSPEGEILGAMGPSSADNRGANVHRGASNASSSYSAAGRSDGSGENATYGSAGYYDQYGNSNPYSDPYSDAPNGPVQPVIRDNPARRNTRIENPSHYPQQSAEHRCLFRYPVTRCTGFQERPLELRLHGDVLLREGRRPITPPLAEHDTRPPELALGLLARRERDGLRGRAADAQARRGRRREHVTLRGGKLYHEHVYWDQASVLVQVGLLDPKLVPDKAREKGVRKLPVVGREAARRLVRGFEDDEVDDGEADNELLPGWYDDDDEEEEEEKEERGSGDGVGNGVKAEKGGSEQAQKKKGKEAGKQNGKEPHEAPEGKRQGEGNPQKGKESESQPSTQDVSRNDDGKSTEGEKPPETDEGASEEAS